MNVETGDVLRQFVRQLLLESLRVTDQRLNEAARLLVQFTGTALHHDLVIGAMRLRNRPPHRVRLLQAVAATKTPLVGNLIFEVLSLLSDRHPEVRAAAAALAAGNRIALDEERAARGTEAALGPPTR